MYGIMLIVTLAIMGGVIAYIGDKLGSKVGKRKWTLFGLRPKYTSILVTIVTGICIAAATLGILSLVSKDVQTALFGMATLKAQLSSLTHEVLTQNTELANSRAILDMKNQELAALTGKIDDTTANLVRVNSELTDVIRQRDITTAALAREEVELSSVRGQLHQSQDDIRILQATKAELDGKVEILTDAKTKLQSEVDRLNETSENLRLGIKQVHEGVVIYQAGEVVATAVVRSGLSESEATIALKKILNDTNQSILKKLDMQDQNIEVLWVSQEDFNKAVSQLTQKSEQVIVRIFSTVNNVYGEPVIGHLELYPNHLIFAAGQTISEESFNLGSEPDRVQETVITFLQKVNSLAISKGILPIDSLKGTVGDISGAELFETMGKIQKIGGPVELSAVAKANIYTAGPLEIILRVRSLQ
jgi:uncharacterized protein (DUF3084 family)